MINILKKIFKTGIVTQKNPLLEEAPDSFRGKIAIHGGLCDGCQKCVGVCPVKAISFQESKENFQLSFDYSKCIYCGFCVDACPTRALSHTNQLKESVKDPSQLIESYIVGKGAEWK